MRFLEMPSAADSEDVIGLSNFDVLLTQPRQFRIDPFGKWETGFFDVDLRSGKPGKLLIYIFDVRQNLVIGIHSHKSLRSIPTGPRECKAKRLVRRKSSRV